MGYSVNLITPFFTETSFALGFLTEMPIIKGQFCKKYNRKGKFGEQGAILQKLLKKGSFWCKMGEF